MRYLSVVIIAALFTSCIGEKRAVYNYLENIKDTSFRKSVYIAEPVIQKNDLLSIQVSSASLDPATDQLYNMQVSQQGGAESAVVWIPGGC